MPMNKIIYQIFKIKKLGAQMNADLDWSKFANMYN